MKTILYSFIAILMTFDALAQTWFPADAEWRHFYNTGETRIGYNQMNVVGEETIDGQVCKKLHIVRYLENITVIPPETYVEDLGYKYVYEANNGNEVYVYENNQFYKLYDFNAQVNDTWTVPNCNSAATCNPNTSSVIVTAVGTEVISGQTLKWIELSTLEGGGANLFGKVYQVIGNIGMGFFPDFKPLTEECGFLPNDAQWGQYLLCYTDSVIDYGTCPADIMSVEDVDQNHLVDIYINQENLFIHTPDNESVKVSLYNSQGQQITQTILQAESSIPLHKIQKGVLIVQYEWNGKMYSKKLLWK